MKIGDRVRIIDSPHLIGEIIKVYPNGTYRVWLDVFKAENSNFCWILRELELEIIQ